MPRYDYRCIACDDEVEVVHGMNETGPKVCARCGGTMRKALSTPAIHFKGSGWAKKDARSAATAAQKKTADTSDEDKKKPAQSSENGKADAAASGSSNGAREASSDSGSSTADASGSTTSTSSTTSSTEADSG